MNTQAGLTGDTNSTVNETETKHTSVRTQHK